MLYHRLEVIAITRSWNRCLEVKLFLCLPCFQAFQSYWDKATSTDCIIAQLQHTFLYNRLYTVASTTNTCHEKSSHNVLCMGACFCNSINILIGFVVFPTVLQMRLNQTLPFTARGCAVRLSKSYQEARVQKHSVKLTFCGFNQHYIYIYIIYCTMQCIIICKIVSSCI